MCVCVCIYRSFSCENRSIIPCDTNMAWYRAEDNIAIKVIDLVESFNKEWKGVREKVYIVGSFYQKSILIIKGELIWSYQV